MDYIWYNKPFEGDKKQDKINNMVFFKQIKKVKEVREFVRAKSVFKEFPEDTDKRLE
jgi:hypothetical protein